MSHLVGMFGTRLTTCVNTFSNHRMILTLISCD